MNKSANKGSSLQSRQALALIPLGIAINLTIGTIAHTLKVPVYLDAIGTIIITLILGLVPGISVGVLSFLIGGLLTNPVMPWFCGTQVAIAVYTHIVARYGGFKSVWKTIASGIGLGVVAAITSAPVIVMLFGGVTGSGASLLVAVLLKSGEGVIKSVVLSGFASEPLDKTIQCLVSIWLLRGLPKTMLQNFKNGSLLQNKIIQE
jgi:energy-coupling factor transport system substrate-specific component